MGEELNCAAELIRPLHIYIWHIKATLKVPQKLKLEKKQQSTFGGYVL